jgi:hypothetical protein
MKILYGNDWNNLPTLEKRKRSLFDKQTQSLEKAQIGKLAIKPIYLNSTRVLKEDEEVGKQQQIRMVMGN